MLRKKRKFPLEILRPRKINKRTGQEHYKIGEESRIFMVFKLDTGAEAEASIIERKRKSLIRDSNLPRTPPVMTFVNRNNERSKQGLN